MKTHGKTKPGANAHKQGQRRGEGGVGCKYTRHMKTYGLFHFKIDGALAHGAIDFKLHAKVIVFTRDVLGCPVGRERERERERQETDSLDGPRG